MNLSSSQCRVIISEKLGCTGAIIRRTAHQVTIAAKVVIRGTMITELIIAITVTITIIISAAIITSRAGTISAGTRTLVASNHAQTTSKI